MSGEKKAFPKFVITYNEILGLIQQGLYPEESKLPPEEELALQMNVSMAWAIMSGHRPRRLR